MEQSSFTVRGRTNFGELHSKVVIDKRTVIIAEISGDSIDVRYWNCVGRFPIQPELYSIKVDAVPKLLNSIQVNGKTILFNYLRTRRDPEVNWELWDVASSLPVQIPLPNCDSFLAEEEREMQCDWLLDSNDTSELLVATFHRNGFFKFVLVFEGFLAQKYLHRIEMPSNMVVYHHYRSNLMLTVVGDGTVKRTVLVGCAISPFNVHVIDLLKGQVVLTSRLSTFHGMTGPFLFPLEGQDEFEVTGEQHELDTKRINWDGKNWTLSTHLVPRPRKVEELETAIVHTITETRVLWDLPGNYGSSRNFAVCDFLLNE